MNSPLNSYNVAERINNEVNTSTTYMTDLENYGLSEYWIEANGYGDCEDYALLKRHKLLDNGWQLKDCCLVDCWTENNIRHCVLLVNTDNGWYILDNRCVWPMPPSSLKYTWDKVLKEDGKWYELSF